MVLLLVGLIIDGSVPARLDSKVLGPLSRLPMPVRACCGRHDR
jgi:hypothetical protein